MEGREEEEGLHKSSWTGWRTDTGNSKKGTASRRVESLDIRTCRETDDLRSSGYLKKKCRSIKL